MKRTLTTICAMAAAVALLAQEPVVVEPKSQRNAPTTTTSSYITSYSSYSSSSYAYSYRDRANHWALGFNIGGGTHNPVWALGLGLNLQYFATDAFRLEASYNGYLRRNHWGSWNVNINLHYLFEVADQLELYPLLGVAFNHAQFRIDTGEAEPGYESYEGEKENFGKFGLNLGGGIQYSFNDHLFVKAEAYWKYMPEGILPIQLQLAADTSRKFGQRAVIIAGVGYRF